MHVKKLNPHATIPTRGSEEAAGVDLYANMDLLESKEKQVSADGAFKRVSFVTAPLEEHGYLLAPGERKLFKTGLAVALPKGTYGRIAPRSGLAFKGGLDVLAGVIDSDYRGDVGIILINFGKDPLFVQHGDRIAQFIVEKCLLCDVIEVDDLDSTQRAEGGWGSTG